MSATLPARRRWWRLSAPAVDAVFGPQSPATFSGARRWSLLGALIVVGTLVVLLRTPRHMWNLLWAEDGAVFVSGALNEGPGVILHGYAGYLHLVPRLAAEIAVLMPLAIVPLVVTILAALTTSLLACASFVFLETRISATPLRLAAWLVCLALPVMGGDVANNLANLHWYLLIAAFCAVTSRSRAIPMAVLQGAVLFAAVSSDAIALLLMPLVLLRLWLSPTRRDVAVVCAYVAGAVLQTVAVVNGLMGTGPARQIAEQHPSFSQLTDLYSYRVVVAGLFGIQGGTSMTELIGLALPGLALGAVIVFIAWAVASDRRRRVGILVFALSSLVFSTFIYTFQWYAVETAAAPDFLSALRYSVVPTALLLLALLQATDAGLGRITRTRLRQGVAVGALVAVMIPVALDYRTTMGREAPAWADVIADGAQECRSGDDLDGFALLPTAPVWFGGMLVRCAALDETAR